MNSNWSYSPETPNLGQLQRCLEPCDLEIWRMTLKNYRAPLLCNFKLCASFRSHWWIQTGVTVRKRPIWVKFNGFLSRVTLNFDGWSWKTIGHLFYATSSFVYHFIAIGKFKLGLQSGNSQSGSNSALFRAVWPWHSTDDLEKLIWGIWKLRPAYSPETPNLGQNRWCFVPCDLEIWWMTLENNSASLFCCLKLCATFHSHW